MNIALIGYGTMGQIVGNLLSQDKSTTIVGIVSVDYLNSLNEIKMPIDCIIDFSHPSNLDMIYDYAITYNCPVVLATTGYNEEQLDMINELGTFIPLLHSSNFSLGITVLNKVIRQLSASLGDDFDIEIIEKHHNKKLDAPSGTAKMLFESIQKGKEAVYGRSGSKVRVKKEVGIHAVRGGTIVGEHEVIFAGLDEVLSFSHAAQSKTVFANGAIVGAKWLVNQKKGLYNMEDVLFKEL